EQFGDASIEIHAYTQALKKVEAQLVVHQQSQPCQTSTQDKAGLGYGDQMNKDMQRGCMQFDFASVKTASTPIKTQKPLVKDEEASDVDVTPKTSHLSAVKRIFRYLKGKPKLGLWYPRVSSFDLEAYSDSDYARANLDMKSTTGGCQFIGRRLIS
ncbi:hypothetical protein Tco_0035306, partial [Tanacetum coccineum]